MKLAHIPDGLYRYVWRGFVVGFVINDGKLTACAPYLRSKLNNPRTRDEWRYRMTTATRIGD